MKIGDIIKMSITLMVVGIVSALVLNFTHGVTAPLIEEQRIISIEKTMFEFFPEANEVEFEELDGNIFQYALDNGNKVGAATMVTASGYGGDVNIIVALDTDGVIKGISVISHSETPGIGDIIDEEDFKVQFTGIDSETSISSEVDSVSGATASVMAVINGVDRGRNIILDQLGLSEPVESADPSEVPDGTYRGEGEGFMGPVIVEVTVEDGRIVDLVEIEHSDGPPEYFEEAWAGISDAILESQSTEVDIISGATFSSNGIISAVQDALNKAVK